MIRWIARRVAAAFAAGLLTILAYLAAAAVGALLPGETAQIAPDTRPPVEIAMVGSAIHVDFVLPATEATRRVLAPSTQAGVPVDDARVEHFIVGSGAEQFYTSTPSLADIRAPALFRAITGDASVLRVEAWGPLPPGIVRHRLTLPAAQYDALLAAIGDSATERALPHPGYSDTDGFLHAHGRFHIFRTCNTWVGQMLRAAGVQGGIWTPTPYAVRLSLWRFAQG